MTRWFTCCTQAQGSPIHPLAHSNKSGWISSPCKLDASPPDSVSNWWGASWRNTSSARLGKAINRSGWDNSWGYCFQFVHGQTACFYPIMGSCFNFLWDCRDGPRTVLPLCALALKFHPLHAFRLFHPMFLSHFDSITRLMLLGTCQSETESIWINLPGIQRFILFTLNHVIFDSFNRWKF